jgi:diacylglycerol kinase (ATP)
MNNLALLVNPAARAGTHIRAGLRAAERLREHGVRTSVLSGGSAAESIDLLHAALEHGADAVAVVGGDGTVNLAAGVLAGSDVPLGVVPAGTGNDFADAIGLTALDVTGYADGDPVGSLPLSVEVVPTALRVFAPAGPESV